jgi:hypothetical protein
MSRLKPCPFCGNEDPEPKGGFEWVRCSVCTASVDRIQDWNIRAAPDLTDDQVHLMVSTFIAAYRGGNGMEAMRSAFDAAFPIPAKEGDQ